MTKQCSVSGCDAPYYCKGFCAPHYKKWHAYGDPLFVSEQEKHVTENNRGDERRCKDCGQWKKLAEFCTKPNRGNRLHTYQCKACRTEQLNTLPPNPAAALRRRKRWLARYRKARLIRNEVMGTRNHESNSLWDGRGRWSQKFSECVECWGTLFKHQASGVCVRCYGRLQYQAMDRIARAKKVARVTELGTARKKKDLALLEKAEQGKITLTPKMQNILAH